MIIKEKYKKIIRDTFLFLLLISIIFFIYNYYNSLLFFDLQIKLIITTTIFGIIYFFMTFLTPERIEIRIIKVKDIKKKIMIFFVWFLIYLIFLNWIYTKVNFEEFIFFILLIYVPVSLAFNLNPLISIMFALGLFVDNGIISAFGFKEYVSRFSIYIFYLLFIGFILILITYLRNRKKY